MKRALALAFTASFLLASAAMAQEAISTAANAPDAGAPTPARPGPPITLSNQRDLDDEGPLPVGRCGNPKVNADGEPVKDNTPHGAIWAGAGTHGYREVGGVVCQPIGKNAEVTIAVDSVQINRR